MEDYKGQKETFRVIECAHYLIAVVSLVHIHAKIDQMVHLPDVSPYNKLYPTYPQKLWKVHGNNYTYTQVNEKFLNSMARNNKH